MFDLSKLRLLLLSLAWAGGLAPAGLAAERLKVRLGPLEQSVAIAEVERFVETGELSPSLRPYAAFLTPEVRRSLNQSLQLDPNLANQIIEDLLKSATGKRLLQVLEVIVQDTTPQQLQLGLTLVAQGTEALSPISFLKAYPQRTITIDATSALAVASQINLKYLESQALSPLLEQDLAVASSRPFASRVNPATAGPEAVRTQTLTFHDQQRRRTIPVDLYWSDRPQGPLVVMSHGFASNRKFMVYLARHLASYGITVAALDHPGSDAAAVFTQGADLGPSFLQGRPLLPAGEFVERPKDISFLLDKLAQLTQESGPLQKKLNTERVSVIGHSLGGHTALALAGGKLDLDSLRAACKAQSPLVQTPADWLQCAAIALPNQLLTLQDQRVAQVIAINPLVGNLFGEKGLAQVKTPTLIVSSTADTVTPALNNQLRPFTQLPDPKYLLTAVGATHLSVSDAAGVNSESTLVKERLGEEVVPLQQLVRGVSLAFIQQLTPQAESYRPFLTPSYAQSLSTPELPLRLNAELPVSITRLLE